MINVYFYSWLVGLPIIYYGFINIFKKNNLYQTMTVNNNKQDAIVSHILTSSVSVVYLSISGLILYNKYSNLILNNNYIFESNNEIINHIITPMLVYQGWNTIITFINKDLYSPIYIIHHLAVLIVGIMLSTNFLQYYLIVYFGLMEISNIFLSIIDYSRYEKYIVENKILYNINNLLFAISFYILRIIVFQYYNYGLIISLYNNKDIVFQSSYIFKTSMILISNFVLAFLQFFWGYKIYKKIIRTINKKNL
jgi:hypothetical protein